MNWIKLLIINFVLILIFFFSLDLTHSNIIPKKIETKEENKKAWNEILEKRKKYRVKHDVYHHDLKKSFIGEGIWYRNEHEMCTNMFAFKISCKDDSQQTQIYDIAFIGDSFTEAVDMSYEQSFVGLVDKKFSNLKVANLGVVSYSPTIYLSKINYLLKEGLKIKHLIVMVDISDIQDDAIFYKLDNENNVLERDVSSYIRRTENKKNPPKCPLSIFSLNLDLSCSIYRYFKFGIFEKLNFIPINDHRSDWTYNDKSPSYGNFGVKEAIKISIEKMDLLYKLLNENDIQMSIGIYPWPDQIFNDDLKYSKQISIWRNFCKGKCKYFINGFEPFYQLKKGNSPENIYYKYYINGDVHFNKNGNKLIAHKIIETLK